LSPLQLSTPAILMLNGPAKALNNVDLIIGEGDVRASSASACVVGGSGRNGQQLCGIEDGEVRLHCWSHIFERHITRNATEEILCGQPHKISKMKSAWSNGVDTRFKIIGLILGKQVTTASIPARPRAPAVGGTPTSGRPR